MYYYFLYNLIFLNIFFRVPVTDFVQGICAQSGLNCNDLFTLITGLNFFSFRNLNLNWHNFTWYIFTKYIIYYFNRPILGENCCLDKSAFDDFMKVEPQSSSTRTLFHLSQSKIFHLSVSLVNLALDSVNFKIL